MGLDIRPEDTVLVRAKVRRRIEGFGVLVELFSRSDRYTAWVREDLVDGVRPAGVGIDPEPPDGTWILSADRQRLWRRDDGRFGQDVAAKRPEPGPRFAACWWDYAEQRFVDWPTAFAAGARPGHRVDVGHPDGPTVTQTTD